MSRSISAFTFRHGDVSEAVYLLFEYINTETGCSSCHKTHMPPSEQ